MSFSGVVHREGLEPSRACAPTVLSRGCLPIPNHLCMVPRAGLEPARAFAPPVLSRRCLPIPNHLGVVRAARIELACSCSRNRRDNHCPTPGWSELRGSNPSCPAWKAGVTPGDLARVVAERKRVERSVPFGTRAFQTRARHRCESASPCFFRRYARSAAMCAV